MAVTPIVNPIVFRSISYLAIIRTFLSEHHTRCSKIQAYTYTLEFWTSVKYRVGVPLYRHSRPVCSMSTQWCSWLPRSLVFNVKDLPGIVWEICTQPWPHKQHVIAPSWKEARPAVVLVVCRQGWLDRQLLDLNGGPVHFEPLGSSLCVWAFSV